MENPRLLLLLFFDAKDGFWKMDGIVSENIFDGRNSFYLQNPNEREKN